MQPTRIILTTMVGNHPWTILVKTGKNPLNSFCGKNVKLKMPTNDTIHNGQRSVTIARSLSTGCMLSDIQYTVHRHVCTQIPGCQNMWRYSRKGNWCVSPPPSSCLRCLSPQSSEGKLCTCCPNHWKFSTQSSIHLSDNINLFKAKSLDLFRKQEGPKDPRSLTWGKGQGSMWSHLQRTTNVVHQILVEDF